jgi:cobalt-zinc-cadmium efflux system protein
MSTNHDPHDEAPHNANDRGGDCGHGHAHGPSHGLGHVHSAQGFGAAFAIGIALNLAFVLIEVGFGLASGSMALLADAGHNLSDVLGLVVAWGASVLVKRPPSRRFTYGLRSSSILAALLNALFLLVACGALALEAAQRLAAPEPVQGTTVMVVAGIGILINGFTAWLFSSGARHDINIRGAYLHMAADAAVSLGVVLAGFLILVTGWPWLDPVVSLVIVAVILWSTWSLLRDSIVLSLAAVPPGIDASAVAAFLQGRSGVTAVHDLHIWAMSTTETALTAHLMMPSGHPGDAFLVETARGLQHRFAIGHATLQIETGAETVCALAPDHVV